MLQDVVIFFGWLCDLIGAIGSGAINHLELLIPTLLTIYGFFFVYVEGNRLARRNEVSQLFEIGIGILEKIDEEGERIWLSSTNNLTQLDIAKLAVFLSQFERCLVNIKTYYFDTGVSNKDIIDLRRALTATPYPSKQPGVAASPQDRIIIIKTKVSEISLSLMDSIYAKLNSPQDRRTILSILRLRHRD